MVIIEALLLRKDSKDQDHRDCKPPLFLSNYHFVVELIRQAGSASLKAWKCLVCL